MIITPGTPEWSTACLDWRERVVDGRPLIAFNPLFADQAAAGLKTFNALRLKDLPGAPKMGDVTREWVTQFVEHIFGSYDAEARRRLISEYFLLISKKNTKSTIAAGIMMTALIRNWRDSAEMIILAPTKEIADNSFFPARDMVYSSPTLSKLLHVQENIKQITHRAKGSFLKVVAADSGTVGGKKASWVLVDELHLFGKDPNAESMLREATGGLASRKEGAVLYLTTQSTAPPAGVFKQKLSYARQVRDGEVKDPAFLPVLYEFPELMIKKKQHRDKKYWYITNPNLGTSVDNAYLEREYTKAEIAGEHSVVDFLAKHVNVEIGNALRQDRWAGADFWAKAGILKALSFDMLLDECECITVGIDGGGLDDLLGLTFVGRHRVSKKWYVWAHAWAHEIVFQRRKELGPILRDLEKAGDLTVVKEPGDDVRELAGFVKEANDRGKLPEKQAIGVDPAGIGDIIDVLTDKEYGIEMEQIVAISQGWRMNGAVKMSERKIAGCNAEGGIVHANQPLMAHAVSSARTEPKGNAIAITKQASGSAKIDPLMAMFNAVSLMALNPQPRPTLADALANIIVV